MQLSFLPPSQCIKHNADLSNLFCFSAPRYSGSLPTFWYFLKCGTNISSFKYFTLFSKRKTHLKRAAKLLQWFRKRIVINGCQPVTAAHGRLLQIPVGQPFLHTVRWVYCRNTTTLILVHILNFNVVELSQGCLRVIVWWVQYSVLRFTALQHIFPLISGTVCLSQQGLKGQVAL